MIRTPCVNATCVDPKQRSGVARNVISDVSSLEDDAERDARVRASFGAQPRSQSASPKVNAMRKLPAIDREGGGENLFSFSSDRDAVS